MAKLYLYYASMNAGKSTMPFPPAFDRRERELRTMPFTTAFDDRDIVDGRMTLTKL